MVLSELVGFTATTFSPTVRHRLFVSTGYDQVYHGHGFSCIRDVGELVWPVYSLVPGREPQWPRNQSSFCHQVATSGWIGYGDRQSLGCSISVPEDRDRDSGKSSATTIATRIRERHRLRLKTY